MSFNHFDERGNAIMVDVSLKTATMRTAVAGAVLTLKPETVSSIVSGRMAKGDVLGVARIAGIAGAKRTPELIPLSHPLAIHHAAIEFEVDQEKGRIEVLANQSDALAQALIEAEVSTRFTAIESATGISKDFYVNTIGYKQQDTLLWVTIEGEAV